MGIYEIGDEHDLNTKKKKIIIIIIYFKKCLVFKI